MPTKRHRLPHTFPHKIVFIISLVLCMCACGGIVNAVVAWSNYLWGYYFGTGFWSGAVMLLAGMFGIVASYVRSICAVKTFMIISIFGCISSLGMIALAAGGLDARSGFYHGYNQTTFMTSVIHAVYLGLGALQLSLGVLSDGICIYYLFISHSAEIYCVKSDDKTKHSQKSGNIRKNGKERSSTGSQAPLVSESRQSKRSSVDKDTVSNRRSQSIGENSDVNEIFPIPYTASGNLNRQALLRQELLLSKVTPLKTPCTRSASFSTFGRTSRTERESLIVHPTDDSASLVDTVTINPPRSPDDECHYAQTVLFGHPVPIEQDEILPPYEIVDSSIVRSKPKRRGLKRPKSEDLHKHSRGRNSSIEREKRASSKKGKNSQLKSNVLQNGKETQHGSLRKRPPRQDSNAYDQNMTRLSRSADLLSFDEEVRNKRTCYDINDGNDVASRNLSNSDDMVLVMDQKVILRHKRPQSQTFRVNRERQNERRRKALSAEFKSNKEQNFYHERIGLEHRSDSIDGSNSSLYAGNRILPTKFSLRQPVRQIGMPHVCSPVPVKPLVHVPKLGPPPKPPRNFSVKAEDLKDLDMDEEVDTIFSDINGLNDVENNDDVFNARDSNKANVAEERPSLATESKLVEVPVYNSYQSPLTDRVLQSSRSVTLNTSSVLLSPEIKLDSGPVLKFVPLKRETNQTVDMNNSVCDDICETIVKTEAAHSVSQPDTMTLPSSPILKPPQVAFFKPPDKTRADTSKGDIAEKMTKHKAQKSQLKFNFKKENDNTNTEVVYAKVSKEKPQSPVSPVSTISPTSPKVLKAKRLTYTFKDRDVSVFDPIGNSKECDETIEPMESIAVLNPVKRAKETENFNKPYEQITKQSDNGKISSQPTVILRQPPLSPSERILQRKSNAIQNKNYTSQAKDNRPVIIQPTNTFVIDLTNNANGARPKTNNGLSSNFMQPQQFHGSKIDTNSIEGKRPVSSPTVSSNGGGSPNKELVRRQMSQGNSAKSAVPPILPKPQLKTMNKNKTSFDASSDSSIKYIPAVSLATISTTGTVRGIQVGRVQGVPLSQHQASNSQGVLHLPQSQLSRQVSNTVPPTVVAMNGQNDMATAAVSVQNVEMRRNNERRNNDGQEDKPLFSMVL